MTRLVRKFTLRRRVNRRLVEVMRDLEHAQIMRCADR